MALNVPSYPYTSMACVFGLDMYERSERESEAGLKGEDVGSVCRLLVIGQRVERQGASCVYYR